MSEKKQPKRWSAKRKQEVVLRLSRGTPEAGNTHGIMK